MDCRSIIIIIHCSLFIEISSLSPPMIHPPSTAASAAARGYDTAKAEEEGHSIDHSSGGETQGLKRMEGGVRGIRSTSGVVWY